MRFISNGSRDNSSTRSERVSIPRHLFVASATITRDSGKLEWNTLLIDCSSHWGDNLCNWHIWSISNGSQNNLSTRSQRVSIPRHLFVASSTITRDPGKLEWNTLLIDCSSQWGEHLCNWIIWSISNGSRNNSSTRSLRISIPRHLCVASATITRDPGKLEWNTLLIDCSSQWGEHLCNWHIWSISNGSRNNSSTRSERVSIPRHLFVASATITRDPGMLKWNTLLIDCSAHWGGNLCNWHIWCISNGSRNNSSTRSQRVSIPRHLFVASSTITRDPGKLEWNTLWIDCSSQWGEHFCNWIIWSISNGSRNNSSTRSLRISIPRHLCVASATITRDPGKLEWNTLLIDCSSQWGEHFCNWHIWSISNGSRDNSSTRSERVSIPRHLFVASATITRDSGKLEWNTLLIDCSSHWGDNLCNWHIWSISNGSQNNLSTRSQRVSIPRHLFVASSTITRDPGKLEWNTLLIDCSSQWGEHLCNWIIWSISNGSRNNSSTRSLRISIPRHLCVASATITRDPGKLEWNTLWIDCSSQWGEHFSNWIIWSISNGSRNNSSTRSLRISIPRLLCVASATITRDPGKLEWNTLLIDCSSQWG